MEKYTIVRVLGEGAFGKVLLATNKEEGNTKVAVKEIKNHFKNWDECIKLRELKALKLLRHPRVVRLREMVLEQQCLYFVFEFMDSNLADVLSNRKRDKLGPSPFVEIQRCMHSLLEGLCFMHKMGLFHRDIKPDNLLCDYDGRNVKIADFGLARELRARPPYTEYVSTRWYRAPEVILCDHAYSSPIDLWAVGCILAELFSLSPLFPGTSSGDQMSRIVNLAGEPSQARWPEGVRLASACHMRIPRTNPCRFQDVLSPYLSGLSLSEKTSTLQLLEALLELDPAKRPSASQSLQHAFFGRFDPSVERQADQPPSDPLSRTESKEIMPCSSMSGSGRMGSNGGGGSRGGGGGGAVSTAVATEAIEEDIDELLGDLGLRFSPRHSNNSSNKFLPDISGSSEVPQELLPRSGQLLSKKSSLDDLLFDLDNDFQSPAKPDFDPDYTNPIDTVTPVGLAPPLFPPTSASPTEAVPMLMESNSTLLTAKSTESLLSHSEDLGHSVSSTPKQSKTPRPFSELELAALVSAVELFPVAAGLDRNVRWKKIAHHVGAGRSKKDCFEAYKEHCLTSKEKKRRKSASVATPSSEPVVKLLGQKSQTLRTEPLRRSEQFAPPDRKVSEHEQPAETTTDILDANTEASTAIDPANSESPLVIESVEDEFEEPTVNTSE